MGFVGGQNPRLNLEIASGTAETGWELWRQAFKATPLLARRPKRRGLENEERGQWLKNISSLKLGSLELVLSGGYTIGGLSTNM